MISPRPTTSPLSREEWTLRLPERIQVSAMLALKGKIPGIPLEDFYCLKFVRICVETALGLRPRGFYDFIIGEDSNPTAHQVEQLLRSQRPRWLVPKGNGQQLGDILFWPFADKRGKQWGHTGIAVWFKNDLWVAQNTMSRQGINNISQLKFPSPSLRLIRLAEMGQPSSTFRLDF